MVDYRVTFLLAILNSLIWFCASENILLVQSKSNVNHQTYFQIAGFPKDATTLNLDEHRALYGYSIATYRNATGASILTGAPRFGNGVVQNCMYKDTGDRKPKFHCEKLKFKGLPNPTLNNSGEQMFLGGSVSALNTGQKVYMLYCGHLYKTVYNEKLQAMGLCNLQKSDQKEEPVVLDGCGVSKNGYSCMAGFSTALKMSLDGENLLLAIGLPGNEKGVGSVKIATIDTNKPLKTVANQLLSKDYYSYTTQAKNSHSYYTGYEVDFDYAHEKSQVILISTTPLDLSKPREPYVDLYKEFKSNKIATLFHKLTDKADHMGGFYGFSLETFTIKSTNVILVGEPFFSQLTENMMDVGRVYVYCGLTPVQVIQGQEPNSLFGFSIAHLGDINGDGISDFAIGCPYCDEGYGVVYVFLGIIKCNFGQPTNIIRGREVARILGLTSLKGFGWSMSGGEDIDGNKSPDLVIGIPMNNRVALVRTRSVVKANLGKVGRGCTIEAESVYDQQCRGPTAWSDKKGCPCLKDGIKLELMLDGTELESELNDLKFNISIELDVDKKNPQEKRVKHLKTDLTSWNYTTSPLSHISPIFEYGFNLYAVTEKFKNDMITPIRYKATVSIADPTAIVYDWKKRLFPTPRIIADGRKPLEQTGEIKINFPCLASCTFDLSMELLTEATDRNTSAPISANVSRQANRPIDYPINKQTIRLLIKNSSTTFVPKIIMDFRNELRYIKATIEYVRKYDGIISKGEKNFECKMFKETRVECSIIKTSMEDIIISVQVDLSNYYQTMEEAGPNRPRPPLPQFEAITYMRNPSEKQIRSDRVIVNYTVVYRPNIQFANGGSKPTEVDDRNSTIYITPKSRVLVDQVGTPMYHVYQLSNSGPSPAKNILVNITVPVAAENGDYIIYIFKELRTIVKGIRKVAVVAPRVESKSGRSKGKCTVPEQYLNPRQLTVLETHEDHIPNKNGTEKSKNGTSSRRRYRRSVKSSSRENKEKHESRKRKEEINCGSDSQYLGRPHCINIQCTIETLQPNDAVNIEFNGWLWAKTILDRRIIDIDVITRASGYVDWTPAAALESENLQIKPFEIPTVYVFTGKIGKPIRQYPIWPIILGIILGILLLAIIILILYKCGFFKRRRPHAPPPPSYAFVKAQEEPASNHNDATDGTPLIPTAKSLDQSHGSVDELDREFADMERNIMLSANEIEMRRRTEEDEAVDRLVRQVSTHEAAANERPTSFPVDYSGTCLAPPEIIAKVPDNQNTDQRDEKTNEENETSAIDEVKDKPEKEGILPENDTTTDETTEEKKKNG